MPCRTCDESEAPRGANLEKERREREAAVEELKQRVASRLGKFVFRGLMILLWVYLLDSMKRYAINYIARDTWFSTFAVIIVVVPIAEVFCILGQTFMCLPPESFPVDCVPHRHPCGSSVPWGVCGCACSTSDVDEAPREELESGDAVAGPRVGQGHNVVDTPKAALESAG